MAELSAERAKRFSTQHQFQGPNTNRTEAKCLSTEHKRITRELSTRADFTIEKNDNKHTRRNYV